MNNREKKFLSFRLDEENKILKELEKQYAAALEEIKERITALIGSEDADLPHVIRRREYQQIVKEQVQAALDKLHANEYATISDYLNESYKDGFVGTMYSLHGQGMPLLLPIDRNMIMKAVTIESKLNKSLYDELGIDIVRLQKIIRNELTRGIASGSLYTDIAQKLSNAAKLPINRAKTIVRTEAGRIQEEATMDAARLTKEKGADVVKQWCAILDGKTRDSHRRLDGQIREIEEYFEIDGKQAMQPHGFGDPEEDCNCRCTTLIRARAALDASELKTLQDRARYFELDKTKEFEEFKKKYLKAAESLDKSGKSGIILGGKDNKFAIPEQKLVGYALNPDRAPDKAKAFKQALGYDQSNYSELMQNIFDHVNESKFIPKGDNGYGMLYEYVMNMEGPNRKNANVLTAWIQRDGNKQLTSLYVTEKKVTE